MTAISETARALHADSIVIDGCSPRMNDESSWGEWIEGGATVAAVTAAIRDHPNTALEKLGRWRHLVGANPDQLLAIERPEDLHQAKEAGRLGVLLAFQDTTALGWDLSLLEIYHGLGVRMIGLCYNTRNRVGDGCGEPTDAGLSRFGRSVVREMDRLGIVVDCSHTGYRTTMQAIELSQSVPVFSHSNVRSLCDNTRNIADDQIRAVAARGGLVGIGGFPAFVKAGGQATLDEWVAHVDYITNLVGVDHVALGLDYFVGASPERYLELIRTDMWYEAAYPPPPYRYPASIEDARGLPNITDSLLKRGYGSDNVRKVLGLNWLRVFSQVWR